MDTLDNAVSQSDACCVSPGDRTPSTGLASENGFESAVVDSRCRKSSRLKAKKSKQVEECLPQDHDYGDAYNLRLSSLVKRVQVEQRRSTPKQSKGKSRPPPLSKYRRRNANARERLRMQEINEGFENLRQCLPGEEQQEQVKKGEKPTKLTILSLAMNYIHALRDVLGYTPLDCAETTAGEESELGSDAASTSTHSVSSASCDDSCSNPSPGSSTMDLKDYSLAEEPCLPVVLPPDLTSCQTGVPDFLASCQTGVPDFLANCQTGVPDFSTVQGQRGSSLSSSASDPSLSPSPLPLPEDCMDLDQSDLLDVSIALAELDKLVEVL